MKTVFKIAKAELRALFYSPIAWFLLIIFFIQCGITYLYMLDSYARTQEIGGRGLDYMVQLTARIFGGSGGVFSSVMQKLYFYIPLLTMGLISREINNGTIRLLYSSPVRIWEIVTGKYLAMMIYNLLLIGCLSVFLVSGAFNIVNPETGILVSAAIGFYLLLCAYTAIGLFMSSLTTYQVVAAVCTFVMIGVLSYIGTLWQGISFVRDLTYFLSLSGRTEHMLGGLITTKDVVYFIIIVYIFLGLTILKLKAGRESKPAFIVAGRYLFVLVSALMIGYISSRPGMIGYLDLTANKSRTLSPNAQKVIRELGDEPVKITAYNNLMGKYYSLGLPEQRNNFLSAWEPYLRFKSNIDFEFVNYYDSTFDNDGYMGHMDFGNAKTLKDQAVQMCKSMGFDFSLFKTPEEIHRIIDLRPEMNRFVMKVDYKGHSTFLRVFDDQTVFPGEPEVSAAFKRLMQSNMPKIEFLYGNLERSIYKLGDRDYKKLTNLTTFRNSLVNQGFDIDSLSLEDHEIPASATAIVIADPKIPFSSAAMNKIRQYIQQGGNMLIAGEPGKLDVINPVLSQLGVQLMEGTIVYDNKEVSPDIALPTLTNTAASFYVKLAKPFKDSVPVSMPGATALSFLPDSGFTALPLLVSDGSKSWLKKGKLVADSGRVLYQDGDLKGSFPMAMALTRKVNGKEQRIIVTGDADLMSNAEISRFNVFVTNFNFNTAMFRWLSNGEFPIEAPRPDPIDNRVTVTTEGSALLRLIYVWLVPAAMVLFAAILLIRRKRQ